MKCILIAALSSDGLIASDDRPHPGAWTSPEDKSFLHRMVQQHRFLVIGSKTYEIYPNPPNDGVTRIVLTRSPEKYTADATERLQFVNATPEEFAYIYEQRFDTCLVLGGSHVFTSFLEAGFVDELYLTHEPVELGSGTPFLSGGKQLEDVVENLPKPELTDLNSTGTTQSHYVLKN